MPYTPKTWENKPSTASPINATNLNHMEGGIKTNDDNIIGAQNAILTLQGEMLQAQGDISALETLVDSIFPVDTESGNPAVITDAFGGACKSLKLTLEPIQGGSGTPSPQNVRPISGRTQSVIERVTFNLYDATKATAGTIISAVNGTESANANYDATDYIMVGGGTSYYIKITDVQASQRGMAWYDANKTYISGVSAKNGVYGVQVAPDNAVYMRVSVAKTDATPCINVSSSRDGEYEVYNGETYVIDLDGTRYGGTVDFKTGAMSVTHLIATYDGSEDESWSMYGTGSASAYAVIGRLPSVAEFTPNVLGVLTANYLENISAQATWGNYDYFISQSNAMTGIDFIIGLKNISTSVNALKTYLAEHPLTVCYKLATPTTVQLTPTQIALLHGDNVLTTDADSIEASYSADIALYIDKKIAEGSQNNRSLSKGGSSDEEVKEDVKEEEIEIKEEEPLTKEVR